MTAVGPDTDLLAAGGKGDTDATNPLSTASDAKDPSRIGDINERAVIHFIEGTGGYTSEARGRMAGFLARLTYDPTNGTTSNGDIFRMGGRAQ